jgi:DNA repair protein RecO (recombination protein O)
MEWTDDAVILSVRSFSEASRIVSVLSEGHGRCNGLVRGRRSGAAIQPGTWVRARWRARSSDNLGSFALETLTAVGVAVLADPLGLAALSSACAVLDTALPEREPHAGLLAEVRSLFTALDRSWAAIALYVAWELQLLASLGFGLDLRRCAVTGETDDLVFVSPRSGRAVGRGPGQPYRHRLLTLPRFLIDPAQVPEAGDLVDGLRLTGYFLERHIYAGSGRGLPAARQRLSDILSRRGVAT